MLCASAPPSPTLGAMIVGKPQRRQCCPRSPSMPTSALLPLVVYHQRSLYTMVDEQWRLNSYVPLQGVNDLGCGDGIGT